MDVSRRGVLCGAGGLVAAWPGSAIARVPASPLRYAEPPWSGRGAAARLAEARRRLGAFFPDANPTRHDWLEDADLGHLAGVAQAHALLESAEDDPVRTFLLTAGTLSDLVTANEFEAASRPARGDPNLCLFALRGCVLQSLEDGTVTQPAVRLRVVRPDYERARCVIGVWRRDTGDITVFSGSTTPNRQSLDLQAAAFRRAEALDVPVWRIANTLASGVHLFTQGRHGGWHPAALRAASLDGRAHRQPALRSISGALRRGDLRLDVTTVMDNVHPGATPAGSGPVEFSSEGCLTVCERRRPARWTIYPPDWTAFSRLVGLDPRKRPRNEHALMLLTGADAWLAAHGSPACALRYGAAGPRTEALRASLGLARQGSYDTAVLQRVMAAWGGGPVTPAAAFKPEREEHEAGHLS